MMDPERSIEVNGPEGTGFGVDRDLEQTIITVTSLLFDIVPEALESQVKKVLGIIGSFCRADRGYLFFFSEDGESVDVTTEWRADRSWTQMYSFKGFSLQRFTWLVQKMADGKPVTLLNSSDLPPEALREREILRIQNIEAVVFVPVFHNGNWIGFFGIESNTVDHSLLVGRLILSIIAPLVGILWHKRKQRESFLQDERRFRALIAYSSDLICILDARGLITFASPSARRMLGYEPEELQGKRIFTFVHPDDMCLLEEFYFQRIRLPGALASYPPFRFRHNDGSWIYLEATGNNLLHEPTIRGVVLNARDVSNRKQIEEELAFEQNLFRTLVNTIPDSVFVQDWQGRILMVNEALLRQCGIEKPRSVIGKPADEVLPLGCGIRSYSSRQGPLEQKVPVEEQEEISGDGSIYLTSLIPFRDHRGKVGGLVGVSRDITRSRQAEDAVRIAEREKRIILNNLSELVCFLDVDCSLIWANQAWMAVTGKQLEETQGKTCREVWFQDESSCQVCPTRQAIMTGEVAEGEVVDPAGTLWWVRGNPVRSGDGSLAGVVEIRLDITEQKKSADRIRFLSYHDSLTGLHNRTYFEEVLAKVEKEHMHPVSVFIGDVNGLKIINDAFGHQRGDELLIRIAGVLKEGFREEDIICRWGGDEFAVLLLGTPGEVCRKILKRVQGLCRETAWEMIPLSISLGYATRESASQDIREVIKLAEDRMYRKKFTESQSTRYSIILSLERSLQETTLETEEHAHRLRTLAYHFGERLRLSDSELIELDLLARLHDLGKIAIARSILNKPEALDQEEWEEIKKHPEIGYRIALSSNDLVPIAEAILSHHERWDGSGYPRGLAGRKIPLLARIISILDAFDVIINGRPYRPPVGSAQAITELRRCAGAQFDPELVEEFIVVLNHRIVS